MLLSPVKRSAVVVLACWVTLTACSGSERDDNLGPIAAVPGGDISDSMEAGIEGTLRVTDTCVLLEGGGQETLLVFRQPEVSWDGDKGEVLFDSDGTTIRLRDGQPVSFGGGGSSSTEDGVDDEAYLRDTDWANAPAESCLRPNRFEVNSVVEPRP